MKRKDLEGKTVSIEVDFTVLKAMGAALAAADIPRDATAVKMLLFLAGMSLQEDGVSWTEALLYLEGGLASTQDRAIVTDTQAEADAIVALDNGETLQ